jgi:antitoxin HicB
MKSYVFKVELEEDKDGRWSAVVPALLGCNAWGYSAGEALEAVREAAQAYVDVLVEDGEAVPVEDNQAVTVFDGGGHSSQHLRS